MSAIAFKPSHTWAAQEQRPCSVGRETYSLTPEVCTTAQKAQELFGRLLVAAGLGSDDARFVVEISATSSAFRLNKTIGLSSGYLAEFGGREHVIVNSLAHELGHILMLALPKDFADDGRLIGLGAAAIDVSTRQRAAQACGLDFDGTIAGALTKARR